MIDRIAAIKNYKNQEDNRIKQEQLDKEHRIATYCATIETFYDRMRELMAVGQACLNAGISLSGSSFGCREAYDTHQFITNGWNHLTGFITDSQKKVIGFGKRGGGSCYYDVDIIYMPVTDTFTLSYKGTEAEYALKSFVEDFDEFEKEFYNYVDRITNR